MTILAMERSLFDGPISLIRRKTTKDVDEEAYVSGKAEVVLSVTGVSGGTARLGVGWRSSDTELP